jgi:hypothetical protein
MPALEDWGASETADDVRAQAGCEEVVLEGQVKGSEGDEEDGAG